MKTFVLKILERGVERSDGGAERNGMCFAGTIFAIAPKGRINILI